MTTTPTDTIKTALIIVLVVLATAGCGAKEPFFPEEGAYRPVQRIADAQEAAGARADANLYACHFDQTVLNSLGQAKLDAMIRSGPALEPLVVHLQPAAGEEHDDLVARMESVTAYLRDCGLADDQIAFADRYNDAAYSPAAPALANLKKTDTAEASDGSGEADLGLGALLGGMPGEK